jgi:hypothetical protein
MGSVMNLPFFLIFCCLAVVYLCGLSTRHRKPGENISADSDLSLIQFLTKDIRCTKNYCLMPRSYQYFDRPLAGVRVNDEVHIQYEFPLIGGYLHLIDLIFEPVTTSRDVDVFGLPSTVVVKDRGGESISLNNAKGESELRSILVSGGWYLDEKGIFGIDFSRIAKVFTSLGSRISNSILKKLQEQGVDTYLNRIQAALNFVQFIPYGLPEFDTELWYYHGLSLPPESIVLGYADCDSKSLLMASILSGLIPLENFIMVECTVNSDNDRTHGGHMMIGVSDLGIRGEYIEHMGRSYMLLETTTPCVMGNKGWREIKILNCHKLV